MLLEVNEAEALLSHNGHVHGSMPYNCDLTTFITLHEQKSYQTESLDMLVLRSGITVEKYLHEYYQAKPGNHWFITSISTLLVHHYHFYMLIFALWSIRKYSSTFYVGIGQVKMAAWTQGMGAALRNHCKLRQNFYRQQSFVILLSKIPQEFSYPTQKLRKVNLKI